MKDTSIKVRQVGFFFLLNSENIYICSEEEGHYESRERVYIVYTGTNGGQSSRKMMIIIQLLGQMSEQILKKKKKKKDCESIITAVDIKLGE